MYSAPDQLFQPYNIGLLNLYNTTLERAIEHITELNNVVQSLTDSISVQERVLNISANRNDGPRLLLETAEDKRALISNGTHAVPTDTNDNSDKIRSIGENVKSIADVVGSIDKLAGHMEKVKGVVSVVTGVVHGLDSVEKLAAATDTMSKISAGFELFTNALKTGEAAAVLGPQAAVFTTLGVLAGDLWSYQKLKSKQQHQHKVSADFMSQGVAGGNEYFSGIQQTHLDAQALVQFAKQKSPIEIQKEEDALVAGWLKTGGKILFDDNAAAKNPAYTSALKKALNISQQMKSHPIKEVMFDDEREQKAFKQNFDPLVLFPTSLLPKVQEYFIENNYLMQKKGLRSISQKEQREKSAHGIPIGQQVSDKIQDNILTNMTYMYKMYSDKNDRKGGELYVAAYVDKLQKQYGQYGWFNQGKAIVMEQFGRAKKVVDMRKQSEGQASGYFANNGRPGNSSSSTINFNKSLIEHFTINVKDGNAGMKDFKRKVEEVLIEILNSVNTIH